MKAIIILAFLFHIGITSYSQHSPFIRLFDTEGKKMGKGFLSGLTDSSIIIMKASEPVEFIFNRIGTIKTRHSIGHTALISGIVFGGVLSIIGAATANPKDFILAFSPAEGAALGAILGFIGGSAWGSFFGIFKKIIAIPVHADHKQWLNAKKVLSGMMPTP